MADRVLSIRLDPPSREHLERLVDASGTNRSDVVRDLIMRDAEPTGVWITFATDYSNHYDVRPHASEIDALRYVADQARSGIARNAKFIPFGEELKD